MRFATQMPQRSNRMIDAELILRDQKVGALNATAASTPIEILPYAQDHYKIAVNAIAYTGYVAGTAQWALDAEVSVDGATGWTKVASLLVPGVGGQFEIPLTGPQIFAILKTAKFTRTNAVKTGAPGDLTYGAWIVNM